MAKTPEIQPHTAPAAAGTTAAVHTAAATTAPHKAKPAAVPGKLTKEQKRGLPPSAKTLAEQIAATKLAKERADVAAADAKK